MQQSSTLEEVRQDLLTELEASKQEIVELIDEELEEVAGGVAVRLPRGGNTAINVFGGIWGVGQKIFGRSGR
jgi:hypothetical protein